MLELLRFAELETQDMEEWHNQNRISLAILKKKKPLNKKSS
jgi:hypothetical protein